MALFRYVLLTLVELEAAWLIVHATRRGEELCIKTSAAILRPKARCHRCNCSCSSKAQEGATVDDRFDVAIVDFAHVLSLSSGFGSGLLISFASADIS